MLKPFFATLAHGAAFVVLAASCSTSSPADPPPSGATPSECAGCVSDGACSNGDSNEQCGGGGVACQACSGDTICAEGACTTPPKCNAKNCQGCCKGDTCIDAAQTDAKACGVKGAACQTCAAGATCGKDGDCISPCGPDTCAGCCTADGKCETGKADATCGIAGKACSACPGGFQCDFGSCISTTCKQTCTSGCCAGAACVAGTAATQCGSAGGACVQCVAGQTCQGSKCVLDPASLWDVIAVNGSASVYDPTVLYWDAFNGLPDPYVIFTVGKGTLEAKTGTTAIKADTTAPAWSEHVLVGVSAAALMGSVSIEYFDDDIGVDDSMGSAAYTFKPLDFDGRLIELRMAAPFYNSELVRFRVVPH